MTHIHPHKLGLVLGGLAGGAHLVLAFLILVGWAQPLFSFIFWLHMMEPVYVFKDFSWMTAISLIFVTSIIGYIAGRIIGMIWNKVQG